MRICGSGGCAGTVNGVNVTFDVMLPAGNNDIAILALDGSSNILGVKMVRAQNVPGAVNGGNTIVFTPSDVTTTQSATVTNVPAGFGSPPVLEVDYLTANGTRILSGVSFEVAPRTVLGVIGASGSGKTTLLRCLNGLERIDGGTIECESVRLDANLSEHEYSRRVKELRRKVGTVFQHLYLFPHLTVLGNIIEAPTHVLRVPRHEAEGEAYALLESVGPEDLSRLVTHPERGTMTFQTVVETMAG